MDMEQLRWGGEPTSDIVIDLPDPTKWDVPVLLDHLPDGRETLVIGDVAGQAEGHHLQGENLRHYGGTCGICSCEGVLRRFGIEVTEAELVEHAAARGECHVGEDLAESGGTTVGDQIRILADHGVPASFERAESLEDLAQFVEHGHGVIIAANAGVLWDDSTFYGDGGPNHAVVATGIARDPGTGEIQGIYVNDSGTGQAARFVEADDVAWGWLDAGGGCVVTDITEPARLEEN